MNRNSLRLAMLSAAVAALALIPAAAFAVPDDKPAATQSTPAKQEPKAKAKAKKSTKAKKADADFQRGYGAAYALVYEAKDFAAGIAAARALQADDNSNVATMIGFAHRQLGQADESERWYRRALASNPANARTLSYYGMWQVERGQVVRAYEFLEKVRYVCGTQCREYTELASVIEGGPAARAAYGVTPAVRSN